MTLDEAIKEYENIAKYHADPTSNSKWHYTNKLMAENFSQLAEWLKELKDYRERTHWTPISEGYPPIEDKYKDFLVADDNGEITVQKLYFTIDIKRQPYFSGMVNPVAWMPSPLPYKVESEVTG